VTATGTDLCLTRSADAADACLPALGITLDPSGADATVVEELVQQAIEAAAREPLEPDQVKAIRGLLKYGRYRATGRGKPAHEFLYRAAGEGSFPRVFPAVDTLNAISLRYGLPMSLIDLDLAATTRFSARRGREGESYVFNAAGQSIGLQDLLLLATEPEDEPCANPVKDSMRTKLRPESRRILAVSYAPSELGARATAARDALAVAYRAVFGDAVVIHDVRVE